MAFGIGMLSVENSHPSDCADAFTVETFLDDGHELLPLVAFGSNFHLDQLVRLESGVDRVKNAFAQPLFPDLHQRFVAVGQAAQIFSL